MPTTKALKIQATKEAAIQEAMSKYKNGEIKTVRAAAEQYGVPRSTLFRRIQGSKPRVHSHPEGQLLTPIQELALVDLILKLDDWGHPMKSHHVLAFAHQIQDSDVKRYPGKHWLQRFVNRHPTLASKVASRLDRERASCASDVVLAEFFKKVKFQLHSSVNLY